MVILRFRTFKKNKIKICTFSITGKRVKAGKTRPIFMFFFPDGTVKIYF